MQTSCLPHYSAYVEKMGAMASIVHKDTRDGLNLRTFICLRMLSMSNPLTACKNRISEISKLTDGWDGYAAAAPEREVVNNSYRFLDALAGIGVDDIDPDEIYPMPYGSIVMELYGRGGMVSMEIGRHKIGFFTECIDSSDEVCSEGEETDFKSVPEQLQKAIMKVM